MTAPAFPGLDSEFPELLDPAEQDVRAFQVRNRRTRFPHRISAPLDPAEQDFRTLSILMKT